MDSKEDIKQAVDNAGDNINLQVKFSVKCSDVLTTMSLSLTLKYNCPKILVSYNNLLFNL